MERGSTVAARAVLDSAAVPPGQVRWSAEPAAAVELLPDGRVRFLRTGTVTLRARVDGASATLPVQVARPPTIVFDLLRDGNRDVYTASLDGADLVRLTTAPGEDRDPTAAGGTVVFVSGRDGNAELYSVPAAGGGERRLTSTANAEGEPALSRDGRRLAFTREVGGLPKLWVSAADGSGAERAAAMLGFGGSVEAAPSWAPDGGRLAFMSTSRGGADLFQLELSSGTATPLAAERAPEVEPAWSPDGRYVAYAAEVDGDTELYLLEVGAQRATRLTRRPGTDAQPAWLADGRLVFTAWVEGAPRLRWLDPAAPVAVFEVPTGPGAPANPAPVT